jgi:hypothetical protein
VYLPYSVRLVLILLLTFASILRVLWSHGMYRIAGMKLIVSRDPNSRKPSSIRSMKRLKRRSPCSKRTLIVRAQMTLLEAMARTGPKSVGVPSRRDSVWSRVSTSPCRSTKWYVLCLHELWSSCLISYYLSNFFFECELICICNW